MADLDRYLRRFRRLVSPPGRPRPAGVPAERETELAEELADVFAAIDAVQEEAEGIGAEGKQKAEKRLEEAGREAEQVLSRGREEADRVRVEVAEWHRRSLQEDTERVLSEARREAEEAGTRIDARLDELVKRVTDRVLRPDTEGGG